MFEVKCVGGPADDGDGGVLVVVPVHVGPDQDIVVVQGDATAEVVTCRAVTGHELGLLRPRRARAEEDVGGPAVAALVVVPVGPDQGIVVAQGDAKAEPVICRAVTGHELGQLRPRFSGLAPRHNDEVRKKYT